MNASIDTGDQGRKTPAAGDAARPRTRTDWTSHTLRRLEPWVAWSIAACTAWVAAVAFSGSAYVWLFVAYAGLIGKWAKVHPSRLQTEMFLRGAALVAGAYVLHTYLGSEVGGPGGPFFFWLTITTLYYAFMLRPRWAVALVALALAGFVASALQAGGATAASGLIAQAGLLCIFPLVLAARFGAVMRQPDEARESDRTDSSTALYNMRGLAAHGSEMLAECLRAERPVVMVVFDCADLLEVRSIYGSRISRQLMDRIVSKLNLIAGDQGIAARTGAAEFTLLLPGLSRDKAVRAVERVLGMPSRIELDAGDSEIVLVPDFTVGVAGAESIGQLHGRLSAELADLHANEQRRQEHFARQRERLSQPAPLMESTVRKAQMPPALSLVGPPTLPVPITNG